MDLSLVPTKELVSVLNERFDSIVIMAYMDNYEGNKDWYYRHWKGDYYKCISMTELLKDNIIRSWNEEGAIDGET